MGLGSQIPPYQSQSRNSLMESTGRSGLGLSYNVRTGSGIAGERGREIGDPVVQDLLLSLREAKVSVVLYVRKVCSCNIYISLLRGIVI